MAMITAYFDGSGSPETRFVSVGGLVSTIDKWLLFTQKWEECLEAFDVPCLHMKDYAHSKRAFSGWKYDEPRRRRFLKALMQVIEEYIDWTAAASVSMDGYSCVDAKRCLSEFMRPYTFVFSSAVTSIMHWASAENRDSNQFAYLVEKGDNDQEDVNRCWRRDFPNTRISPIFLEKCDILPGSETWEPIRPFEACDLIAYENLKGNIAIEQAGGEISIDRLRQPLQRMQRLPGASDWLTAHASELEKVCDLYCVAVR
jgi:hypothetical protein